MYSTLGSKCPIYCINLAHRPDRKEHTKNEFKKLNIPLHEVTYPYFVKDKRGGSFGCYDSHLKVWQAFTNNYPEHNYCLVLEDDFTIPNIQNAQQTLEKSKAFLEKNIDHIDILFLHNLCIKNTKKVKLDADFVNADADFVNADADFVNGYGFLTHAYLITRHYIHTVLPLALKQNTGEHIDFLINIKKNNILYSEKLFYTNQPCFIQLNDKSDNYANIFDELFRRDINERILWGVKYWTFIKKIGLVNDDIIKKICCLTLPKIN